MSKNAQALYNAMILYHELHHLLYDTMKAAGSFQPADIVAVTTALNQAYTDLMAAVATYNANPEK